MAARWLNIFFRYSGFTYSLKRRIVSAGNWTQAAPFAVVLIITELGFAVISLPMYLIVKPESLQEEGIIFPRQQKVTQQLQTYAIRRRISLATFWGAGGILALKLIFIGAASLYLFGVQELLADTQDWTFSTDGDYTYDSAKIEFVSGVARLKNTGTTSSGTTTNPGFTTDSTGWTYADWLNNAGASGAFSSTGGNPGGNVRISLSAAKNKITAGYYRQSFVTTVASPDTATLNFDWSSISYSVPAAFDTYQLYAFIDTASGDPVLGTEVWSSGEITGATAWANSATIDITGKVPTAGTYYLKIAAYSDTPGTNGTYATVAGFDNVIVNWIKTTVAYASDKPTTTPTASLTMTKTVSWDSFTETATKNGGEIYYQLSSDNGANWKFWNGTAWATSTLATDYNIAADVNTRISSFTTSTNQIKWRAFLSGDGTQQVILDNVAIGYTPNTPPQVQSLAPAQNMTYGYVHAAYNLADGQSDPSGLVAYEYSLTGAFAGEEVAMAASSSDPAHTGVSGLSATPAGAAQNFVWDARSQLGNVYDDSVYVRLRANDGIHSGNYTTSSAFAVDFVTSTVSNVAAVEAAGTTTVQITYDLFDNTADNITVELQISGDGGSTWTVPATAVTGDIGTAVASGNGKSISWQAGTDYSGQQKSNMRVRLRAKDKFQNQGDYTSSADFSLDTLNPATLTAANLLAQPNAGDTAVLIGGSFTEANPNANGFMVAINGGDYSATTTGDVDTATPANQSTAIGATLDGNDYISAVKINHTDDYGLSFDNTNASPDTAYKYVKPYTPSAPTLSNPVTTRLDLQINAAGGEAGDVEYAVAETTTGNFVQSDGTLGASPVWQAVGTGSGQWGNGLSISGRIRITGLSSPVANYIFKVKSRNPSDSGHAASSESAYSATAQIPNTAPTIVFDSNSQTTDGTRYVPIYYSGTDGQGDIVSLPTYQYSTDGSNWFAMTEKSGAGSDGLTGLIFLAAGNPHDFAWNSGADLPDTESATVRVRLVANDTLASGATSTSGLFEIDNKNPVVSAVAASQAAGTRNVAISYDLADANDAVVIIDVSSDGGSTWTVATTTMSGSVGAGVAPGSGKSVTWNAGTDFNGQYNSVMQLRFRVTDTFGNSGTNVYSAYFTIDTKAPVLANLTAAQDAGARTFTYHYDISEDAGTSAVVLAISADSGSTWTVATTTAGGDTGSGLANGTGKTITWNAGTDYADQEKSSMRFRISAYDQFNNNGLQSSADFSLDTLAPRLTSVSAVQPLGGTSVTISYDLADQNNSFVALDISANSGSTWTVATTSLSGALGANISAGAGKSVTWNAGSDFSGQALGTMRVRVRGLDAFGNQSASTSSANFDLDTLPPAVLSAADLQAQPLAGATTTLIGGSFTETNPNTNSFYVAINGGAYGSATAGAGNTASPADLAVAAGATLDGNDYVSQVKIAHADDYGLATNNENSSPAVGFKYVKPYAPAAATVTDPALSAVTVIINKNAAEVDGLEYAIYETTQNKFVQSNGTLGASAVWQVLGTGGVTEWGFYLSASGNVRVTGLANPAYTYQFQVKSRNPSDAAHAASSESALSASASSANQSPTIAIVSASQTTDGSRYVTINYTGTDLEGESASLASYEYSTNNSTWQAMTEKAGVGSDGGSGLAFASGGTAHDFMWDVGTDLANTEDETVYIRLKANDGTSDGNLAAASAFTVDTKNPVASALTAAQDAGSNNVSLSYNLTDLSASAVEIYFSGDSGSSWLVASSTATGDVGSGVSAGTGKAINWNPGTDYSGQESATVRARTRAIDAFGNQGSFVSSADFSVDTKAPVFANIAVAQIVSSSNVRITYDISDANNSAVAMDISSDGGSTWTVASSSVSGDIGSGVAPGAGQEIIWNAGFDYPDQQTSNMRVRLRATDYHANATGNVSSGLFSLNTLAPNITGVAASQTAGTDNVVITYNLFDADNVEISLDISSDGGSTWSVATSSATGAVGSGIVPGLAKSITWNAGANYNNQQNATMKARLRGTNDYGNTGTNSSLLGSFTLDTLAPATLAAAELQSQPQAGETTVLIGGSFTEANPDSNSFFVAVNGGAYAAATAGQSDTATPADQETGAGATLDGNDYISSVKIVAIDDYGHERTNENASPDVAYKYVKPYAPSAPTVANAQNSSVDVTINAAAGEAGNLEYALMETGSGNYVQNDGSLAASQVWKTLGTGAGQWGAASGVSGKIAVNGLSSPVGSYSFKAKSRNPSDAAHAASSESDFSAAAGIANTAPSIAINSVSQQSSGGYVLINYTGTDAQNDTNSLNSYEYSVNNISWQAMTEKSGVGSDGVSSLAFAAAGTAHDFAWDISADLPNQEQATVYIRLQSSDAIADSNLAQSSAFNTDTRGPVVSNISASQAAGSAVLTFTYDLSDSTGSGNSVSLDISDDGGATWAVAKTSLSGDVGAGITAGTSRSAAWNASVDFSGQEQSDMKVRLRGTDSFGNIGSYAESAAFVADAATPTVSSVSASQTAGSTNIAISYTLSDLTAGGHLAEFSVSSDGGATWTVATTTASGNIGSGQTTGAKTFSWSAGTDYSGQDLSTVRVRVRARDYFGNQGAYAQSANFALDTAAPVISNLAAAQNAGLSTFAFNYNLSESSQINLDISSDGGATWNVAKTTLSGDVNAAVSAGAGKTIAWDAGTDYGGQENSAMRWRIRGIDSFNNASSYYESGNFSLDTGAPIGLISLAKFSQTASTLTLNWQAVTDANFDHFEIWHGASQSDVSSRSGAASLWDATDDADLSNPLTISTVITGLGVSANYYAKIFAIDDFGNESTVSDINVFTPAVEAPVPTLTAAGAAAVPVPTRQLAKPILTPLPSPTRSFQTVISGLAEPRSRVDLYDNGVLVGRLISVADASGQFRQVFSLAAGSHSLSVRAVDFSGNASPLSDPVVLEIVTTAPPAPLILSPRDGAAVTSANPVLIGVAEPFSTVEITLDALPPVRVAADADGAWRWGVPSSLELSDGPHAISARQIDEAGNAGLFSRISIFKIAPAAIAVSAAGTVPGPAVISQPVPAAQLISETVQAVELPGIPVPQISQAASRPEPAGDIMTFSGVSIPDTDVVVYIHSEQALIYRAHTDDNGVWTINHSQATAELAPGEHTIYAVAVDGPAQVKSRPSAVSSFTVKRNPFAAFIKMLNLPLTALTLIILLATILWLYRLKQVKAAVAI